MNERPRRNRKSEAIRSMVRETHLSISQLVYPLFVCNGKNIKKEVTSLPGNYVWSCDLVLAEIQECLKLGINNFILFPKVEPELKDAKASYGYSDDNFYFNITRAIKVKFPQTCLISDIALDPYNIDGHDGIVKNGKILNDETLALLQKMALLQAKAGFDILGPSDMMDGRVGAIREALDQAGYSDLSIMSYTAKYASAFYGPFRDALGSAPINKVDIPIDKKSYQMDPANAREALREAELDAIEGADFLMVKPALHYLDVIHMLKASTELPIVAYHVSGECAMLLAAAKNGWLDYESSMKEVLLSIRRAGADIIISYLAKDFAKASIKIKPY